MIHDFSVSISSWKSSATGTDFAESIYNACLVFCSFHMKLQSCFPYARLFKLSAAQLTMRVHNRFGGMRDLANFCGDIRDGSWKQEREAGISFESGSGVMCFRGVGIRYFNFYETAWFDQHRLIQMDRLWMNCVSFQVMHWSRKSSLNVKLLWVLLC